MQQNPDLSCVCLVYNLKKRTFGQGSVCVYDEWIIIAHLTGSQWSILFSPKFQNNTQAHLRVLWACWMSFASGTEWSAQESGCPPKTIFVSVALFQTFTVYYILQPALF